MTKFALLFISFVMLCWITRGRQTEEDGRVVCYISTWSQFRPVPAQFVPSLTDPFLCTHVIYAHAKITETGILPEELSDLERYDELQRLKLANPRVKTMLSVGGPLVPSSAFSNISKTSEVRRLFAQNAVMFLRTHGFDGLDIDWRYPMHSDGVSKEVRGQFPVLLRDIRNALEKESQTTHSKRMLLSAVLPGTRTNGNHSYPIREVTKSVDFLNVLSVDLNGHWGTTGHPTPLFSNQEVDSGLQSSSLDSVARAWMGRGVTPAQLNMGLSFHGMSFLLPAGGNTGNGAQVLSSGPAGNYTSTRGKLAYFEICQLLSQTTPQYLEDQRVPYLVAGSLWVGYEDKDSLQDKVWYLQKRKIGGVAVWYIDEDDFSGAFCSKGHYPLLKTVSKDFLAYKAGKRPGVADGEQDSPASGHGCGRIVCYVSNSAMFRPGLARFLPSQVDAKLCTHFVYAHASLDGTDIKPMYPEDSRMYLEMAKIRDRWNPSAKVLLSVGGWEVGSAPFSRLVPSEDAVRVFAGKAAVLLRNARLDGLDVDWQYPANRGSSSHDKQLFTKFLQVVKEVFDSEANTSGNTNLLLTATIHAQHLVLSTAYELPEIIQHVDFANFMTFGLHGLWEGRAEHHSPLHGFSRPDVNGRSLSVCKATEIMVKEGVPMAKLNMGLSFYGNSFTVIETSGMRNVTSGKTGNYTMHKGYLSYFEVCSLLREGAQSQWNTEQVVPFARRGDQWVAYDNQRSISEKVKYAKHSGYGGLVIWSMDADDFRGDFCGQGSFPLLRAALSSCQNGGPAIKTGSHA